MKYPKNFGKWNASEQESWLVSKLQEVYQLENQIKITLAKIRGGEILIFKEVDRLDLLEMKDEN
jgi:hypothetical protein